MTKKNQTKSVGYSKSNSQREVQSDTGPPQNIRKISNKQPNLPSKRILKRRINKTSSKQREGNNKDLLKSNRKKSIKPSAGSLKG